MSKLIKGWKNYSTCEDCAFHLKRDVMNIILYGMLGYFVYPYLDPYPVWWWLWNFIYGYLMVVYLFMLNNTTLSMFITRIMYTIGEVEGARMFYEMKRKLQKRKRQNFAERGRE